MRGLIYEPIRENNNGNSTVHNLPRVMEIANAGVDYFDVNGAEKFAFFVTDIIGNIYICDDLSSEDIRKDLQMLNKKGYCDFGRHLFYRAMPCAEENNVSSDVLGDDDDGSFPPEVDASATDGWTDWGGTSDAEDLDDEGIRASMDEIPDDEATDEPEGVDDYDYDD